jgi:hypothetical protein
MKAFLKRHFPQAGRALHFVKTLPLRFQSSEQVFSGIHRDNAWAGDESVSGPGSSREATANVRRELPKLLGELGVHTLLDAPCGDFHWLAGVDLPVERYHGVDVVAAVIAANRERYGSDRRAFAHLDLLRDPLPRADLILCRDCLVHFSFRDIERALAAFLRSGATYLLTTTFPLTENRDIVTGEWRPINLETTPFRFPPPLRLVDERYRGEGGRYADKSLGLWRLTDLTLAE